MDPGTPGGFGSRKEGLSRRPHSASDRSLWYAFLMLLGILPSEFLRTPFQTVSRNCLKSPEGASNVASQGTEAPLFGPFRPRYTGQIHPRSVAQTPFQTVS